MFTHMVPVKTCSHTARNQNYDIMVFQVGETGEHRIYISKGDTFGAEKLFVAMSGDILASAKELSRPDLVEEMICVAKDDIDRNEYGEY